MYPLFFFKFSWLCWVFMAAHRFSPVAVSEGYSLAAVGKLLIAVASLVTERGLRLSWLLGSGAQPR